MKAGACAVFRDIPLGKGIWWLRGACAAESERRAAVRNREDGVERLPPKTAASDEAADGRLVAECPTVL